MACQAQVVIARLGYGGLFLRGTFRTFRTLDMLSGHVPNPTLVFTNGKWPLICRAAALILLTEIPSAGTVCPKDWAYGRAALARRQTSNKEQKEKDVGDQDQQYAQSNLHQWQLVHAEAVAYAPHNSRNVIRVFSAREITLLTPRAITKFLPSDIATCHLSTYTRRLIGVRGGIHR